MQTLAWTESEFERWFRANPELPGGERVLVLESHQPFGAMVDLLALDARATPISIEVKNEAVHEGVTAQILRYLPRCYGVEVADLVAVRPDLRQAFKSRFDCDLPERVAPERRLIIVAPSFAPQIGLIVRALRHYLRGVTFQLASATRRSDGGFDLAVHEPPDVVSASTLAVGTIGLKPSIRSGRFRAVVVIDPGEGSLPVLWQFGHYRDGKLTPLADDAVRRRSLRRKLAAGFGGGR